MGVDIFFIKKTICLNNIHSNQEDSDNLILFFPRRFKAHILNVFLKVKGINHIFLKNSKGKKKNRIKIILKKKYPLIIKIKIEDLNQKGKKIKDLLDISIQFKFIPPKIAKGNKKNIPLTIKISISPM